MHFVHDMDLNLLRALDALLETRSVSGAAEQLHLSQPAMSRALGRIRRVVGDPVLVRAGHTMQATPWAEQVQTEVRALLHRAHAVLARAQPLDLASLERTFTIMANDANVVAIGSELLTRVRQVAPGVRVRFLAESPGDDRALRDGSSDLNISTVRSGSPEIHMAHLGTDRHVAVVRAGHPLTDGPLTARSFAAAPQIVASRRGRLTGPIDEALADHGLQRKVVVAAPTFAAMLFMISQHDLVGTVPERQHGHNVTALGLVTLPLPIQVPPIHVAQSWHARNEGDQAHAWFRGLVYEIGRTMLSHG